jgi:hypothetical protein
MATYSVKAPDGGTYQIQGPDDADPSDVISQVMGGHKPQSLDYLGNGQTAPTGSPAAIAARNPATSGTESYFDIPSMSLKQRPSDPFVAGMGKASVDIGRGAGQMIGAVSRQDVADSRKLDAPLMATTAGKAGNIVGTAADLLPTAFIPGAGTLAGAGAIGAGTGLLQPSTSTGETAANTAIGGVMGPAAVGVGRGLGALYQGAKSAVEPLLAGGQERIAARTLQSFAGDPAAQAAAATRLSAPPGVLPGVQPTTAELADNAGLAQLERTVRNNPEGLTALTARNQANRGAMTGALGQIAQTPADVAAATAARSATVDPLYQAARSATVPADAELGRILARPSVQQAWDRAAQLAAERGETLTGQNANDINGGTLQYLKMALQDATNAGPQRGMGAHEIAATRSTLGDLQGWIGRNVPELRTADQAFAQGSAPINQMQIGQELSNRLQPALADFGNNSRLNAASYANAVRGGDAIAQNVTGNARATLAGTLTPDQTTTIRQIGEQLARRANADELGRAVGSNTGQNLASQNLLRQLAGPLGLPQGMAEKVAGSTLAQTIARPYQFAASAGEPRIMQALTRASLDPQYAAQLLRQQPNSQIARMIWARQGLLGVPAGLATPGVSQGLLGLANAPQ